jgi:gliding motility-associated-like protein
LIKSKFKHIVLIVLMLFAVCSSGYAIKIHRICPKGNDVILMYYNVTDTCNQFLSLIIYARENPFDVFKPIGTITDPSLTDFIHVNAKIVSTKWEYFIKLIRKCPGKDSVYSDTMAIDLKAPNIIEIDSITVKNGKTEIGWKASKSADTKGYVIYYQDISGGNTMIDTVFGIKNTFYRDKSTGDPNNKIERYEIAAIDSCDNITIISNVHNTILHSSVQDTCKEEITLNWNKYARWTDPQTEYGIYYSKNGNTFGLGHLMPDNKTTYTFTGLENNTQYCFYVRAHNKDSNFFSTSNITCLTTNFIVKPAYVYLKNVTVINNNQLEISWAIDTLSQIKEFKIYRKISLQPFSLFKTLPYDNNTDFFIFDDSAKINTTLYRYYVEETDICNNLPIRSNEGGNILLENDQIADYYQLKWNRYSDWNGDLKSQTLYSKKEEEPTWSYLDNPAITDERYIKNLLVNDLKGKEVCFYIENEEGNNNKYGYQETSTSNLSCISGTTIVFVPNAFCPKGVNTHFIPVGRNIDSTLTEIKIYSRWGQQVWKSKGITMGWDGRDNNGREMPLGVYYYYITIIGKDKTKIDLSGNVSLLK